MRTSVVAALIEELWADVFAPADADAPRRIGAEVELIPVDVATRRRCPIVAAPGPGLAGAPATLPVLRRVARREGWCERPSPYGAPVFTMADGGTISYEPGGQIEYSAPASESVSLLVARLRATVGVLAAEAARSGIALLTVGIDPQNSIDDVPLQLHGPRYTSMDAYFATIGPAGARMMRQTAALQVTVDAGPEPVRDWRVLSAIAPYLTAIFANSPRYEGTRTGWQSTRAQAWRRLDRARTGLPAAAAADPAAEYAGFALRAPAILRRGPGGAYQPFGTLLANGDATVADWGPHLTTLFPEVRPRSKAGVPTFELRSMDALAPVWYAAPITIIAGLAYDDCARRDAAAVLGDVLGDGRGDGRGDVGPSHTAASDLLVRAARDGLRDPAIRRVAGALYSAGLRGAARLGEDIVGPEELEIAQEFGARYTLRGRSPADDIVPASVDGVDRPDIGGAHATVSG